MVVIVAKGYWDWKTFRKLLLTKYLSYHPAGRKKKASPPFRVRALIKRQAPRANGRRNTGCGPKKKWNHIRTGDANVRVSARSTWTNLAQGNPVTQSSKLFNGRLKLAVGGNTCGKHDPNPAENEITNKDLTTDSWR